VNKWIIFIINHFFNYERLENEKQEEWKKWSKDFQRWVLSAHFSPKLYISIKFWVLTEGVITVQKTVQVITAFRRLLHRLLWLLRSLLWLFRSFLRLLGSLYYTGNWCDYYGHYYGYYGNYEGFPYYARNYSLGFTWMFKTASTNNIRAQRYRSRLETGPIRGTSKKKKKKAASEHVKVLVYY